MGYPTKIQLISRTKGNQWYVNFPNALAEAMNFEKGETVEWTVLSRTCLQMNRRKEGGADEEKRVSHARPARS